jgi:hypothetical protein
MTLLTVMEIASNYPDNILIDAIQCKETKKWGSYMYLTREGNIHKLMLSFDNFPYETEEIAVDKMKEVAQLAIKHLNEKDD